MKNNKNSVNLVLVIILLILIVSTAIVGVIYIKKQKSENTENIEASEESVNYYNHWNSNGEMNIDIDNYVKLSKDYKKTVSITENERMSEVVDTIENNSTIVIPQEVLNTYKEQSKETIIRSAEAENISTTDYLIKYCGATSMEDYIRSKEEIYIDIIKRDLIYQALAKDLNIAINENDVKEYFKESLSNGYTYDELKDNYGEKLMYKYTLEDKVQTKLKEVLKK